jgi:hypothetical protein
MTQRQQILYLCRLGHGRLDGAGPALPGSSPPYASGVAALRDGWMLLQSSQLTASLPGNEHLNDRLRASTGAAMSKERQLSPVETIDEMQNNRPYDASIDKKEYRRDLEALHERRLTPYHRLRAVASSQRARGRSGREMFDSGTTVQPQEPG